MYLRRLAHISKIRTASCTHYLSRKFCQTDASVRDSWKGWTQYENRPQDTNIEQTSIFLFPGQGSQFVGMGKHLLRVPKVREMFQCANEMLRTDLLKTCLEGPQSKLDQTVHCQPATYIISLASVAKLQEDDDEVVRNCVATAGFSVGEVTALVFAGSMTFEQGLHVIRVRAEAMQKACDQTKGAMTSVFLSHDSQLKLAIAAALEHCKTHYKLENPECRIANYLYSDCKVVAGHIQAIEFIEQHAPQFRIRRVKRLPVNGAFHTSLMRSAVEPVSRAVSRVDQLKPPSIPVVSALDILPYTTAESVRRKLSLQLVRPVKWEQTLHALYIRPPDTPFPVTIEPGPGKQLGAMLRMANRKAFAHYRALEV